MNETITLSATDLAYIAGLIDGEGCISIDRIMHKDYKKPGFQFCISVCMTDEFIIRYLYDTFGGYYLKSSKRRGKDAFYWRIAANEALKTLNLFFPYLRVKKQQAQICKEFQELRLARKRCRKTDEEWNIENDLYWRVKELNKRWTEDG